MFLDGTQRHRILSMLKKGKSVKAVALKTGYSESTIRAIKRGEYSEQFQRKADNYEHFSQGGSSGNFDGTTELLTQEQLEYGDPLAYLIAMEDLDDQD